MFSVFTKDAKDNSGARDKGGKDRNGLRDKSAILSELWSCLYQQREAGGETCDVTIICCNGSLSAHSSILGGYSSLFKSAFDQVQSDEPQLILMPDYKIQELRRVLELLYLGMSRAKTSESAAVGSLLDSWNIPRNYTLVKDKKSLKIKHEHNLSRTSRSDQQEQSSEAGQLVTSKKRVMMASLDPSQLTCSVCNKVFTKLYKLRNHELVHSAQFPFICSDCGKGFNNKYKLNAHEKLHSQANTKAPSTKTKKAEKEKEAGAVKEPHSCQFCGEEFKRLRDMNTHVNQKHKHIHQCMNCASKFPTQKNLITHLKVVHNDMEGILRYVCPICGKRFLKLSHLEDHKPRHNPIPGHACMYCPKRCATKQDLDRHLASHLGEARLTCQLCLKTFVHRSNYAEHLRKHLGQKPYTCRPCGKFYAQFKTLRHHQTSHHEARGDRTVLVIPNKGSRGVFSYIDHILSEAQLTQTDQKNKSIDTSSQMYIPGPHYIQSSESITPLKQMQVITDYTEISRIGYHNTGQGAAMDNLATDEEILGGQSGM